MTQDRDLYNGREQTYIKHVFLRRYLEGLAIKVLAGGWDAFNYVDGFAGPWNTRDNEGFTDASFGLAVDLLETVRKFVEKRSGRNLKVRFFLCEKNSEAVVRLREFAENQTGLEIHVFEGAFEDNLDAISARIPNGFTFTFIDPTNWVVRIEDVCEFLKAKRGEFLFNFMTEEVSRHSVNPKVANQFGALVGDPDWQETAKSLPEGMRGELKVLHLLKEAFRNRVGILFLPDFSILKPLAHREKMRLMLGTDSPEGLKLFRDTQAKVEGEEFKSRRQAKTEKTRQDMLFSEEDFAKYEQGERGVGCKRYKRLTEERVLKILSSGYPSRFSEIAVDVMEELPMKETHVKDVLKEMRDAGKVSYELEGRAWKPNAGTIIFAGEHSGISPRRDSDAADEIPW